MTGGSLIAVVPNAKGLFGAHVRFADITHELSFAPRSVSQICAVTSLELTAVVEHGPLVHGVVSAMRWAAWQVIRSAMLAARLAAEGADWRWPVFTQDLVFVARKPLPRRIAGVSELDTSVLLLPGVASDDSRSMTRYARELFTALSALAGNGRITLERPVQRRYLSGVMDGPLARRIDSAWSRYVAYPRSLRRRKAGVFHILDHGYAHLIRSLDPDRTVVTCHDLIPLLAAEGVIPVDVPPMVARTFRLRVAYLARARAVIAVSDATKVTLERYTSVRSDRIVVIPQGVNPTFRFAANRTTTQRASAGLAKASAVVLQVASGGRYKRYKNTPVLLHAFAQLRSRLTGVVLVRIGAPFHPDEAELARKLGICDAIRHPTRIDDDRGLADWYNAADVLVFPSLWEGFGWPPLEAMACGTPVVASDIPAIAEVVGNAGLLVPADDPSAVARATEQVLTDTALASSLRQKGLERASHFTWANTAARTLAVYNALIP